MTTPATPPAPKPSADGRNYVAADENLTVLTFEDRLRIFWQKNGKAVIIGVVIVLVGLLAKGGWEYLEGQKELGLEAEFAASNTPEKLKAFAAAHPGHSLSHVAHLELADQAYTAGRSAEAISGYELAVAEFKTGPLASRAKLGLAMSKVQAGKTADGETELKALAADTTEPTGIRTEASYNVASLASSAGRTDDARKYAEQVMQIDPNSPWTQRALMLRATLPMASVAPVQAVGTPALTLPSTGK